MARAVEVLLVVTALGIPTTACGNDSDGAGPNAGTGGTGAVTATGGAGSGGGGVGGQANTGGSAGGAAGSGGAGSTTRAFGHISAGTSGACVVPDAGTGLKCWGSLAQFAPNQGVFTSVSVAGGGCGLLSTRELSCWSGVTPQAGQYTQVSVGSGDVVCAVRADRTITCFSSQPTDMPVLHPPSGTFSQIDTSGQHACALKDDGNVLCWGDTATDPPVTPQNPPPGPFRQVATIARFACALRADSTIQCWGKGNYLTESKFLTAPTGAFVQLSGGILHTCALRQDGTVACWGEDDPSRSGFVPGPDAADRFIEIDAGDDFTCGIRTDGSVACWGVGAATPSLKPPAGLIAKH